MEWTETTVGDICSLGRGRVISQEEINEHPGPFPVFSSQTRNHGQMGSLATFDLSGQYVTWTTDGENAGTVFFRSGQFNCTNVCGTLLPRHNHDLDLRFLTYHLGRIAKRYVSYIGNPKLMNGVMASIGIILPPLDVQIRIAEILSRIDVTIEKTESLITKYQQIKTGLMHDLFTRGVTADGKLRPPREQAPELYKETPIGWIPKEWGCKTLEQLLAPVGNNLRSGPFGSALLKDELVEEGIPFLGIDNIYTEHFEAKYRRFVSQKKFMELHRYSVRPKDVVITIMGTVGRCCVLPDDIGQALSSKHLWTMTLDQSQVFPELVCWQLNYAPWVLSWFRRESQGAVMDAIQSSTLRTLRIPVPGMPEQEVIIERYLASTSKIESEQSELNKLKKKKAGLMHDLLTGRVLVVSE